MASGQCQVGEPKVNRDAARLLLRQAIGIGTRQSLHERALAVIHVAGGGENVVSRLHVAWRLKHACALTNSKPGIMFPDRTAFV